MKRFARLSALQRIKAECRKLKLLLVIRGLQQKCAVLDWQTYKRKHPQTHFTDEKAYLDSVSPDKSAPSSDHPDLVRKINHHLNLAAMSHGIDASRVNFFSIAINQAIKAGARPGIEARHVALEALGRAIHKPHEDKSLPSKAYAGSSMLPSRVLHLKQKGHSLEEIKKDRQLKNLIRDHSLDPTRIDRAFNGILKPNKAAPPDFELAVQKKGPGKSVFEAYTPEKGPFSAYMAGALRNESAMVLRQLRKDRVMNDATSILPERSDSGSGLTEGQLVNHTPEPSERRLIQRDLLTRAEKLRPGYGKAVKLILEGRDPFSGQDMPLFQEALKLPTRHQYLKERPKLFSDLKQLLSEVGVNSPEEAEIVLKSANRQNKEAHVLQFIVAVLYSN